jgi:hypothetical protein
MRSSVPAFWECSRGRILLRELSTQFGRKRYLLPVSRVLPAKLNRPLFRLCPKLLPSLLLPKAPGRKTQAIAIVLAATSMSFLNLPADHLRKSLPSGPMRFAVDRIRPGHMKSLGLRFRDEGQATRKSTRVRCGNGWNVVAIRVARVVRSATTCIRTWVARCCNATCACGVNEMRLGGNHVVRGLFAFP